MSNSSIEPSSGRDSGWTSSDTTGLRDAELSEVLIIGKSHVNRVVVAKIVEKSGLKPQTATPEDAVRKLASMRPGLVILDGGADNRECEALLSTLVDHRRVSTRNIPSVILLTNRTGTPEGIELGAPVDAVVAKPITPESLQPVVDRLFARTIG